MRRKIKTPLLMMILALIAMFILMPMLVHRHGKFTSTTIETHQTEATYFERLSPRVQELSQSYGIRPSVLLGQMALSSDYGKAILAHEYHNIMSLEAEAGQDFIDMTTDSGKQRFAVYSQWEDGIIDYLERLRAGQIWGKPLYDIMATTKDYKEVAKAIQKSRFTTDKDYAKKLINIIEANDLTQYDK